METASGKNQLPVSKKTPKTLMRLQHLDLKRKWGGKEFFKKRKRAYPEDVKGLILLSL